MLIIGITLSTDMEKGTKLFLGISVEQTKKTQIAWKINYIHKIHLNT